MNGCIARCVAIESIDLSEYQLSIIGKTLHNLISLSNQMTANRRICHLSIEFIDKTLLQLIPMSKIDSIEYFNKLLNLSDFKSKSYDISLKISDNNCLVKCIELLMRKMIHTKHPKDIESIEVIYISGRRDVDVIHDICQVSKPLDLNSQQSIVSMINIMCIKTQMSSTVKNSPILSCPQNSDQIPEDLMSLIEWQTIIDNEYDIEGYFKVWFHDLSYDFEKIRICLGSNKSSDNEIVIKCDLREALLDVDLIPIMRNTKLNSNPIQISPLMTTNETINKCYELKIVGLVKYSGLCDSVVFGIPYVLSPTRCHRLSFKELDMNADYFHALTQIMGEKEAVVILELKQTIDSPNNYFALLSPPDRKTLLMKSVAAKELLLPYSNDSVDKLISHSPTQRVIQSVRNLMDQFECCDIYNPLLVSNNLYQCLSQNSLKQNQNKP